MKKQTKSKRQPARPKVKVRTNITNDQIDYKNIAFLKSFMGRRNQILPKKYTKLSTKMQRMLAKEVKKARQMGLLKYTERH